MPVPEWNVWKNSCCHPQIECTRTREGEGGIWSNEKFYTFSIAENSTYNNNYLLFSVWYRVECLYHSRLFPIDKIHIFIRFDFARPSFLWLHWVVSRERGLKHGSGSRAAGMIENRVNWVERHIRELKGNFTLLIKMKQREDSVKFFGARICRRNCYQL